MKKFNETTLKGKIFIERKIKEINCKVKGLICNESGDQMTSTLIILLAVVVVGALFLTLFQANITTIWNGIMTKIKSTFGI